MFKFLMHFLLRKFLESRIKSAFIDRDEKKTRLKQWLAVAHGGQFDSEAWNIQLNDQQSLVDFGIDVSDQYLAKNRMALSWYERIFFGTYFRRSDLAQSQTYYKSIVEIWLEQKRIEQSNDIEPVKFHWYQRFLNWCVRVSGLEWTFNATNLKENALFETLRQHEGIEDGSRNPHPPQVANEPTSALKMETPSIREKYSVAKLLNSPDIIAKRMTKPSEFEDLVSKDTNQDNTYSNTPPHMRQWLTALRLNQTVDHLHQQQVQHNQNLDNFVNAHDLQRIQETTRWTDDSVLNPLSTGKNRLNELKYSASQNWLMALDRACKAEWEAIKPNRNFTNHQLSISTTALEKLLNAKGHIRSALYTLDLDALPLGFFIDKNTEGNIFVLKYNEKYRLHQLATLRDAALRLDVNNPASDFHLDSTKRACTVTKNELLNTLSERHIELKPRHLDFLNKLDNETHRVTFKGAEGDTPLIETKAYAFRALKIMAETIYPLTTQQTSHKDCDPFLCEFIDILDSFSKIDTSQLTGILRIHDYEHSSTTVYLNNFILNYLKGITNGKEFYAEEIRDALKRYATFNRNEFMWLMEIESATRKYNLNFSETSKGLLYFFDFFEGLGIPVPARSTSLSGYSPLGGFIELKHILDCISLAGHGKNILAKQFQAEYAVNIPKNYALAKSALRAGYAFVHESMLFGIANGLTDFDFDHQSFDLHQVTREEFERLHYGAASMKGVTDGVYFRAMYLRFISFNVDPRYFKEAINTWERITGTTLTAFSGSSTNGINDLETLNSALQNHWKELQHYGLALPSVMAANKKQDAVKTASDVPEAFINVKEALLHAEKEYLSENVDSLLEKIKLPVMLEDTIKQSIYQINKLTKHYAEMSESDLQDRLKSAKQWSLEERIACLRETHCRLTCSQSSANPPKGEWLRLEQLVSVLIAMKEKCLLQIDTGEGKTFILQLIALLKALDNKKVNVITHNESLALDAGDKIKKLAYFLGLKTAKKNDSTASIINADILYTDISSAVINDLLAKHCSDNQLLPGHRKADVAVIDEVDNVVIDIHANTTMQISQGSEEASEDLAFFLKRLNSIVRTELPKRQDLPKRNEQRDFIRQRLNEELSDNLFYRDQCGDDCELDQFIRAAISAATLTRDIDYVVEDDPLVINEVSILRKVVHIMHKDTTGRADKLSQWGEYIHQCVAAHENEHNNPSVVIPGISNILAEGDVLTYLNECYTSRIGVTATMGNQRIRNKIEESIKTNLIVEIPRAIRPLGTEANWPLKEGKPVYNRLYRFPPMYKNSKSTHYETLLEVITKIQENNQSCIIFWNTIAECDDFFAYLKQKGISTQMIQILDDTHDTEKALTTQAFRPSEATVIARANESRMITLTTAAGSRGTDFDNINIGILAKPNLGRVTLQKSGRIARNGQFGQVYEIYYKYDLNRSGINNKSERQESNKENCLVLHRSRIFTHEVLQEEHTLRAIEHRKPK
ncbi:DEAD/DEAH box helicase [Legionella worsleiensis]|uniref:Preprotein translocase, secretion protein SecA subunit n=1 Tax=Legionella worsleiensis TaxID=45076 RepID=A0A0W1AFN0_9GAMM|nr:DEAD/DEAH box helicase [Legionella worsleiensis]KTD80165.1 preprotein translocase, secretion protein SecA subunit [Legionella worsleiensis]STY31812.1 preprotein translocase, secretion protein SecA subunit [Legionella worsleiensis]